MAGRTSIGAAAALLVMTGAAWAQNGPSASGAAGAAQSQGVTATPSMGDGGIAAPKTTPGVGPAPGAPAVGSGSGASTGAGLGETGGLGAAGSPAAGAAAQSTVPAPPAGSAKP